MTVAFGSSTTLFTKIDKQNRDEGRQTFGHIHQRVIANGTFEKI